MVTHNEMISALDYEIRRYNELAKLSSVEALRTDYIKSAEVFTAIRDRISTGSVPEQHGLRRFTEIWHITKSHG